ncbi:hypothetical protein TNCV_4796451 [Trichonephila clavipes]|uniref:Uncharacterized protein n=1 Tax=Trichonephila clavipes TaxID=2585209 RepID=A0A8X6S7J5_TRICX|nr:hypothetical protein TNCV_4796451 [Trichonephila clavipes]
MTGELRCELGLVNEEVWPLGGGTNGVKEHFSGCGGGLLLVRELMTLEMKVKLHERSPKEKNESHGSKTGNLKELRWK